MVDLAPGTVVEVENPDFTVDISQPGTIRGVWLVEGPPGKDGPAGPVASVNGDPGPDIVLDAADVGARPAGDVPWTEVSSKPATFPPSAHTHAEADVTGLSADLAAKVPTSRTVSAGTGLTGGGDLSANRTLAVAYGTTAGTAAQGNDARITGAAQKASNLSDLADKPTARTNLGLGSAAVANTGTASGQVPVLNASGRLDVARLASGTPDGTKFVADDGTLKTPAGGSSGGLLNVKEYTPATATTQSSTTSTVADVDATNLAVAATVPASGAVLVVLEGYVLTSSINAPVEFAVRIGSTDYGLRMVSVSGVGERVRTGIRIPGLTPGSTPTFKFGFARGGSSGTATVRYGDTYGPAQIEVWSAA